MGQVIARYHQCGKTRLVAELCGIPLKRLYCSCVYKTPLDAEPCGFDDDWTPLFPHLPDCDQGLYEPPALDKTRE